MKQLGLILLVLTPACATTDAAGRVVKDALAIPAAAVSDVTGAVGMVIPGEPDPAAQAIGQAAGDVAGALTGNPIVDMAVTALVGGLAGFFIRKRKKPAA